MNVNLYAETMSKILSKKHDAQIRIRYQKRTDVERRYSHV